MANEPKCSLTSSNGAPVTTDQTSITAGERGPLTFDNWRVFEKLAHFNRERIPERVVHARGSGRLRHVLTLTKTCRSNSRSRNSSERRQKDRLVCAPFDVRAAGRIPAHFARRPAAVRRQVLHRRRNRDMGRQ